MARAYLDNITTALGLLEKKILQYSHLNLHDINIHIENIFRDIFNILYSDRNFLNLNTLEANFSAIDLGDDINEIAFQITSTTSKAKVLNTITKYKDDYSYEKVIMFYPTLKKPKRTKGFEDEIDDKFLFEEWDLRDLLSKINDATTEQIRKIQQILLHEVTPNLYQSSFEKNEDDSALDQWDSLEKKDVRNFKDKILAVNKEIRDIRIEKYCRDIASGKAELINYSERLISSMKYRIFEVCQDELLEFCEEVEEKNLTKEQINSLIERYTERACKIIEEKSQDYSYPLKNKDLLRKLVLALIDECYLSFDEIGIYT
jgi:hypothetical protein